MHCNRSRRNFVAGLAGVAAAALAPALVGCRRRSSPSSATSASVAQDLDEVENAASFRPPLPDAEPLVRVRVLKVRDVGEAQPPPPLRIGDEGQWIVVRGQSAVGSGAAVAGPIAVAMEAGGWSIIDGKGFRAAVQGRESIDLSLLDAEPQAMIAVHHEGSGRRKTPAVYPGALRLVSRHDLRAPDDQASSAGGAFDLINDVPIESYLPGVLAGELYETWHGETFAAQAIAARSFACTEAAVFAARRHYDLTNTAASQMYVGGTSHRKAREAVEATRGIVLAYESLLVSGYYSSCCGGAAASAIDAIGSNPVNDVVPLQGRAGPDVCAGASVYQWTSQQGIDELSQRVANYGRAQKIKSLAALGRLASIDIIAANSNGRPRRMRLVDQTDQSAEVSAEDFRRAANHGAPAQGIDPPAKPLRSSHVRVTFGSTLVTFEGFGFGHGVGLCQHGAEALARQGTAHRQIALWYYPGADLIEAYGPRSTQVG